MDLHRLAKQRSAPLQGLQGCGSVPPHDASASALRHEKHDHCPALKCSSRLAAFVQVGELRTQACHDNLQVSCRKCEKRILEGPQLLKSIISIRRSVYLPQAPPSQIAGPSAASSRLPAARYVREVRSRPRLQPHKHPGRATVAKWAYSCLLSGKQFWEVVILQKCTPVFSLFTCKIPAAKWYS